MPRTWQDLTQEEFEAFAKTIDCQAIANRIHTAIYPGDEEHSPFLSCGCTHQAINELLLHMPEDADRICPNEACGPLFDATEHPELFPLSLINIPPHQLGKCPECGSLWQWNVPGQKWVPTPKESNGT